MAGGADDRGEARQQGAQQPSKGKQMLKDRKKKVAFSTSAICKKSTPMIGKESSSRQSSSSKSGPDAVAKKMEGKGQVEAAVGIVDVNNNNEVVQEVVEKLDRKAYPDAVAKNTEGKGQVEAAGGIIDGNDNNKVVDYVKKSNAKSGLDVVAKKTEGKQGQVKTAAWRHR